MWAFLPEFCLQLPGIDALLILNLGVKSHNLVLGNVVFFFKILYRRRFELGKIKLYLQRQKTCAFFLAQNQFLFYQRCANKRSAENHISLPAPRICWFQKPGQ
jgi:hypothetical protein